MTATAKSTGVIACIDQADEIEDLEGGGVDVLNQIRFGQTIAGTPATAQQEADDEAEAWSQIWGAGTQGEKLQWPSDMGEELPKIVA